MFVGGTTRQKGVPGLLRVIAKLPPKIQVVLCIRAPDTLEVVAETETLVEDLRSRHVDVV